MGTKLFPSHAGVAKLKNPRIISSSTRRHLSFPLSEGHSNSLGAILCHSYWLKDNFLIVKSTKSRPDIPLSCVTCKEKQTRFEGILTILRDEINFHWNSRLHISSSRSLCLFHQLWMNVISTFRTFKKKFYGWESAGYSEASPQIYSQISI